MLVDFLGSAVEVGARIVYPQRAGSLLWLVEAQVTKIGPEGVGVKRLRSSGPPPERRNAVLKNVESVVVLRPALEV